MGGGKEEERLTFLTGKIDSAQLIWDRLGGRSCFCCWLGH